MLLPAVVLVAAVATVVCSPLPEKPGPQPHFGGFQPVSGARGAGPAFGYRPPPPSPPIYTGPSHHGGGGGGVGGGGHLGNPTKTIYVNVPPVNHPKGHLPPVAGGPPRKHYKIVFIRAPAPPPQIQPILPPRTEQSTRIYVLVQKPQPQEQKVINVPHVQHDPEVYFVQYDKPPSAEELQQLSTGNLDGYTVSAHRTGHVGSGEILDAAAGDLTLGPVSVPSVKGGALSGVASEPLVTAVPLAASSAGVPLSAVTQQAGAPSAISGSIQGAAPGTLSSGTSQGSGFGGTGGGFGVPLPGLVSSQRGGTGSGTGLRGLQFVADDDDDDIRFGSRLADDFSLENLPLPIRTGRKPAGGVPLPLT